MTPKPDHPLRYEAFMEGCARYAAATEEGTADLIEGIVKALSKKKRGKNRPRQ